MGNEQTTQLEWSLYENGMDSIRHGIEHYTSDVDERRRYKYAILHMSQGLMLLLKERLRQEHPSFIFTNVADETKTVDVDLTLSRLKKVAKVEFTEAEEKVIRELGDLRNKIEHFALTISKQQADSIISRLLPFLVSFTQNELGKSFEWEIGRENWQALLLSQEYRINAIHNTERQLQIEGEKVFFCPDCQAYTASMGKRNPLETDEWKLKYDEVRCRVCNRWVCGLMNCRQCGKEIVANAGTLPQNACYCEDCAEKLKYDFPEFYYDTPTLWLVGELRRWFASHDEITGEQLFRLLYNVRGPGSGLYAPVGAILRAGVIDFLGDNDRLIYDTLNTLRPSISSYVNDYDRFKWAYSAK